MSWLRLRQLNWKKYTPLRPKNFGMSFSSPYLSFLEKRYQDMANVIAISAEAMGDLRKGSETKWIIVRQWPSPDTWPSFPGSLGDLVHGRHKRRKGWTDWSTEVGIYCHALSQAGGLPLERRDLPWWITVSFWEVHTEKTCKTEEMLYIIYLLGGEGFQVKRCIHCLSSTTDTLQGSESLGFQWDQASEPCNAEAMLLLIRQEEATRFRVSITSIWTMQL